MPRSGRLIAIGLLVVLIAGGLWGMVGSAQSAPSISIAVNGNNVSAGERVVVPGGNLSVRVTGEVNLSTVIVRIDGEDVHTATPDRSTHEIRLDPDFSARSNTVRVIVKDANGDLWSQWITVYKDTIAPKIELESPFTVRSGYQFPDVREDIPAKVSIRGTIHDASAIESVSVRIIASGRSVETTSLAEDGSFTLNTSLVSGNNSLIVSATDEYGHRSYRQTRLVVTDEEDPTLTFPDWPTVTETNQVRTRIVATDDIGVDRVRYRISGLPERVPIESPDHLLDAGRTRVVKNVTLELPRPGHYNVTFNVTDVVGNYEEIEKSIEYDPVTVEERITPEIHVHSTRSGLYNDSLYRLNATVTNGSIREVSIEARNRYGIPTFLETIYDGPNTSSVAIVRDIPIDQGRNEIDIEVTDATQSTHYHVIEVDTTNTTTYEPPTIAEPTTTDQAINGTTLLPTTNMSQTTAHSGSEPKGTTPSGTLEPTPTEPGPENTRISVTKSTPLAPATGTSLPLSPILTIVALLLVALLYSRPLD